MNRATDCGIPANLAKMAAYKRFADTNSRMANSPNLVPITSFLLDNLEPATASRMAVSRSCFFVICSSLFCHAATTISDFPTFHALCKQCLWSGARTDHEPRKDV